MALWKWRSSKKVSSTPDPWIQLSREEARLWMWTALVTVLALSAFALSAIPLSPQAPNALLHLRFEQVAPGLLALLLLFNTHTLRRRWEIRRARKELTAEKVPETVQEAVPEAAGTDSVTGLVNRKAAELQLGREMAATRRRGEPLSLLVVGLDGFSKLQSRLGTVTSDQVLRDFAQQLRKATRGCDLPVRFGNDEFLAVLPGCPMGKVQQVISRLSPLVVDFSGEQMSVDYSTSWLDPQPGETPEGLLRRAHEMLKLYKDVDAAAARTSIQ